MNVSSGRLCSRSYVVLFKYCCCFCGYDWKNFKMSRLLLCLLWRFKVFRYIFIHHIIIDSLLQLIMHAYPLHSKLPFLNQAFCDYTDLRDEKVHPIRTSKSALLNKSGKIRKLTALVRKISALIINGLVYRGKWHIFI